MTTTERAAKITEMKRIHSVLNDGKRRPVAVVTKYLKMQVGLMYELLADG